MKRISYQISKIAVALSVLIYAIMGYNTAYAARMDGAPAADCDGLTIATGPSGKGYSKLFNDLKKLPSNGVNLCEVHTSGGLDNLSALSEKKAKVGIVQLDTLKAMAPGDENIASLLAVMPLNNNYLHVLVSSSGYNVQGERKLGGLMSGDNRLERITSFSQLKGKRVALVGSAQLLGRQLEKQLNYGMIFIDAPSDDAGIAMVQKGQVQASLSVSGWPMGAVKNLTQANGITLVPFDAPISSPYTVKPFNYKNIGVYNVQALAIQNVLVTRPFNSAKANDEVLALKKLISDNLNDLKDGDFEPGWNEVKNVDATVDMPRFTYGGTSKVVKK